MQRAPPVALSSTRARRALATSSSTPLRPKTSARLLRGKSKPQGTLTSLGSSTRKSKALPTASSWEAILGADRQETPKPTATPESVSTVTVKAKAKLKSKSKGSEALTTPTTPNKTKTNNPEDARRVFRERWEQLLRERAATQSALAATARNRRLTFATLIDDPNELALYRDRPVFSVLSWNIMSDAHLDAIGLTHLKALPRERRSLLLLEALLEMDAHVLALQEVERDLYYDLLEPQLKKAGYEGVHHERGQFSPYEHKEWSSARQDGCAFFWKTDKFELVGSERAELRQVIHETGQHKFGLGDPSFLRQFMYYSNIVSLAQLRVKESGHLIALANTHLYANQLRPSVQIAQAHAALLRLAQSAQRLAKEERVHVPTLFCGDLNATPASPIIKYVLSGELSASHSALEYNSKKIAREDLRHPLALVSAYHSYPEPSRQLDYVFLSRDELVPLALLQLPKGYRGVVRSGAATEANPSDHLPIMAHLAFAEATPRPLPKLTSEKHAHKETKDIKDKESHRNESEARGTINNNNNNNRREESATRGRRDNDRRLRSPLPQAKQLFGLSKGGARGVTHSPNTTKKRNNNNKSEDEDGNGEGHKEEEARPRRGRPRRDGDPKVDAEIAAKGRATSADEF